MKKKYLKLANLYSSDSDMTHMVGTAEPETLAQIAQHLTLSPTGKFRIVVDAPKQEWLDKMEGNREKPIGYLKFSCEVPEERPAESQETSPADAWRDPEDDLSF